VAYAETGGQTRDRLEAEVNWLGGKHPSRPCGVAWGVPWPRGRVAETGGWGLVSGSGARLPVQTWVAARWPDGSVKWTGHAAVLGPEAPGPLYVVPSSDGAAGRSARSEGLVAVERQSGILVDTGALRCEVAREGDVLLREMSAEGTVVCAGLRLVAERERRSRTGTTDERSRCRGPGVVRSVVVEQVGSERCVLRAVGAHSLAGPSGAASWLPFIVRLYFYRGLASVRLVHTFVVDCDPEVDFPSGIGVECEVPLTGPAYQRYVAMGGEDGMFSEPCQLLWTWRAKDAGGLYDKQIEGQPVEIQGAGQQRLLELLERQAIWRSFKLVQDSPGHYRISKRTRQGCAWVSADEGSRAAGVVAVWGRRGGLAIGVREFWQKAPRSVEVDNVVDGKAAVRAWLWSPDAEPMDLRHYDTETHVDSAYEGFDEMRADPRGIANTNEIWLEPLYEGLQWPRLEHLSELCQKPPLLVCQPSWYYETGALGTWSLPSIKSSASRWVETQLGAALEFYKNEVEQRRWYGFWDYGDFMHSYDPVRHCWRYDLGGYAWQNTELAPNLWLWYSFLRTGRADVFALAAAMARHTSEVDVYHAGQYAGLGSRHNVRHWGCGCKEARISMAGLHRAFYYLTTDERMGEVMAEVTASVESSLVNLDPARTLVPKDRWPTHVRSGPDWAALCSDWMTDWERTGNSASLAAIETGVGSLTGMPLRLASGPVFGYDPSTKVLGHIGDNNYSYHMVVPFGGAETWMELSSLLRNRQFDAMLCELASYAAMADEERKERSGGVLGAENWSQTWFYARLVAFAAAKTGDNALARRAWEMLLHQGVGLGQRLEPQVVAGSRCPRRFEEIPWVSTNVVSQWCLNVIECLALVPEALEEAWAAREVGAVP